ncbi:MAG: GDP-mannose 4,6-dehydratase [Verrucomicrobia bacterium]|nr:GDP-mannose 4,6-dehydratase [Verrucomicrobiota bacterium]
MQWNGRKVLVTGGSGFIGARLVGRLLEAGATLAVTVRYGNVVKNERLRGCWEQLQIIEADLRNRGALEAVRRFSPRLSSIWPPTITWGRALPRSRSVLMSTPRERPTWWTPAPTPRDSSISPAPRSMAIRPPYLSSRTSSRNPFLPMPSPSTPANCIAGCASAWRTLSRTVVLRPFNAYGPYQSSKAIIPELILKCLRGLPIDCTPGEQTREFNFVEDLVDGFLLAAAADHVIPGPVNLAAGQEVAIRDLVQTIARLTASSSELRLGALPYRPTEIWRMRGDPTRARQWLGWEPKTSLEEGLGQTVEWFRGYLAQTADSTAQR